MSSVSKAQQDLHAAQIETLAHKNKVLTRAKESLLRKNSLNKARLEKKIGKLQKENSKQTELLDIRERDIRVQQLKLREFMQRNLTTLPAHTFAQIEDIINSVDPTSSDQQRRMADTYKTIQKAEVHHHKYGEVAPETLALEKIRERRKKSVTVLKTPNSVMPQESVGSMEMERERYKSAVKNRPKPLAGMRDDGMFGPRASPTGATRNAAQLQQRLTELKNEQAQIRIAH